jgi:hypothetical protein
MSGPVEIKSEKFVSADPGWRVVFVGERGELLIFPVIFWRFFSQTSRGRDVPKIQPMACMGVNYGEGNEIEDASQYESYLGVLGPDESEDRYRRMAVEAATEIFGTSPLEMLAEAGKESSRER